MNVNEPIGFGRCPRCQHSLLVALDDGLCLSCAAEKILALEVACWTAKRPSLPADPPARGLGNGLVRPPANSAPCPA